MRYCSVEGCTRKHHSHGYCRAHLNLIKRNGKPESDLVKNKGVKCKAEGCEEEAYKKGYCNKHFQRFKKYGSTELPEPKVCSVEGCGEFVRNGGPGFCRKHYQRVKRNGTTEKANSNTLKGQACKHCGNGVVTRKDFCNSCYHKHMMETSEGYCGQKQKAKVARQVLEKSVRSEPYTRKQVFEKSGGICGICGLPIEMKRGAHKQLWFTIDHIQPLSKGGEDTLQNVQAAHSLCNTTKNNLVLAEEKMFNLREKISKLLEEK